MTRQIIFVLTFVWGLTFISQAQTVKKDTSKTSEIKAIEVMPDFPGGMGELMKFVNKNKQYENDKDKNKNVGIVMVTFVIEKDGSIEDSVKVIKPLTEFYNKEAIRIVKAMPKWVPGTKNGEPVRVQFNLPIKF